MPKDQVRQFTVIPQEPAMQAQGEDLDTDTPPPVNMRKNWTMAGKPAAGVMTKIMVQTPIQFKKGQSELAQTLVMSALGTIMTETLYISTWHNINSPHYKTDMTYRHALLRPQRCRHG